VTDVPEVRIVRAGPERIPDLEPLFGVLHEHQVRSAPRLTDFEARAADEAWQRRRSKYEKWLAEPGAFVLFAETSMRAVGFALVSIGTGYDGWYSPERIGDVHDLAVLPDARGRGVGTMLMDAVEDELRAGGVSHCRLRVIARNTDAIQFYERRGMSRVSTIFLQRIDRTSEGETP
jgi:ribosomal protein S18 acetylase RimI-like enzyme